MLITFYSRADADVIMFGKVGRSMLNALGKDPLASEGIITLAQLPQALAALQAAMEADHREQAAHPFDEDDEEAVERARHDPIIHFSQRAYPLLSMLQHSLREKTPVTWKCSGAED